MKEEAEVEETGLEEEVVLEVGVLEGHILELKF